MRTLVLGSLAVAVLSTGCAAMRGASARDSYLQSQVVDQPIAKPVEQVWPALKAALFSKGVIVGEIDDNFFTLKTLPKVDSGSANQLHYYDAKAQRLDANSCRIQVIYVTEATATDGRKSRIDSRDWQFELEVLKSVDPARAEAIEAEGQRRYDSAYNEK